MTSENWFIPYIKAKKYEQKFTNLSVDIFLYSQLHAHPIQRDSHCVYVISYFEFESFFEFESNSNSQDIKHYLMALNFRVYLISRIAGSKYFAWIYFREFTRFFINLHRECGMISRLYNLACTYFREKAKNSRNREILYTPIFSAVRYIVKCSSCCVVVAITYNIII